jgi:hypothetical protein
LAAGFGKQPREPGTVRRLLARSGIDDEGNGGAGVILGVELMD